jgi:hypothetical protein
MRLVVGAARVGEVGAASGLLASRRAPEVYRFAGGWVYHSLERKVDLASIDSR